MIHIRAFRRSYRAKGINIFIDNINSDGKSFTAEPIVMTEIEPYTADGEPTVVLPEETAQQLIDDLWDAGLRPSEGSGSAGAFAAQGAHLKDLQRIVFKNY